MHMVKPTDYGHFSYIPIKGHTKEWFKKDLQTIRNSFKKTLKIAPIIFLITFLTTCCLIYFSSHQLIFDLIIAYTLSFGMIVNLGFFLLHVLKTKGYDIESPSSL